MGLLGVDVKCKEGWETVEGVYNGDQRSVEE